MDWKILTKLYDRIEADMMKEALSALNIPVELAQESAGDLFPVNFGKMAEIHLFVPKEKFEEASEWLKAYEDDKLEEEEALE